MATEVVMVRSQNRFGHTLHAESKNWLHCRKSSLLAAAPPLLGQLNEAYSSLSLSSSYSHTVVDLSRASKWATFCRP